MRRVLEQYFTSSQTLAQCLRQLIDFAQTVPCNPGTAVGVDQGSAAGAYASSPKHRRPITQQCYSCSTTPGRLVRHACSP